ncbi:Target of EGR1, member 1 (Nuclear) [Coelomomyces lativittatus]|nr:Target of EGR1, member 1 (Nuclear) [Coelomomyces lativittatus]KAJ1508384.1 Target of EGR1, member 1 (Nuclear) [Coelomomyces lativittatus]KAJ1512897.1 Target of EGR1, member 1 (Nuclear) [Coelomomyces lativittatus]
MVFQPPPLLLTSSSLLSKITHTLITSDNWISEYPTLVKVIQQAEFVALDLEFTGLPYPLNLNDLNERYASCARHAKEFGLLSLGISCFLPLSSSTRSSTTSCTLSTPSLPYTTTPFVLSSETMTSSELDLLTLSNHFEVHTYHLLLRREGVYKVSSSSLFFLATSGFNFQHQQLQGITYCSGTLPSTGKPIPLSTLKLRELFQTCIFHQSKPRIVHNGFLDLMFMYQGFYATLPSTLATWLADMSGLFPGGVYDTKYIEETYQQPPSPSNAPTHASFGKDKVNSMLAPLFLHYEHKKRPVHVTWPTPPSTTPTPLHGGYLNTTPHPNQSHEHASNPVLTSGTFHPEDEKVGTGTTTLTPTTFEKENVKDQRECIAHSAHMDAFMTGYIFACQYELGKVNSLFQHKIYLPGKPFPLTLQKSAYTSYSVMYTSQTQTQKHLSSSSTLSSSSLSSSVSILPPSLSNEDGPSTLGSLQDPPLAVLKEKDASLFHSHKVVVGDEVRGHATQASFDRDGGRKEMGRNPHLTDPGTTPSDACTCVTQSKKKRRKRKRKEETDE